MKTNSFLHKEVKGFCLLFLKAMTFFVVITVALFGNPLYSSALEIINTEIDTENIEINVKDIKGLNSFEQTIKPPKPSELKQDLSNFNLDRSNAIVNAALKFIDNEMDCYALVMRAYNALGYEMDGVMKKYDKLGDLPWFKIESKPKVATSQKVPGDIIHFPGKNGTSAHWAIWGGNNTTINGGYLGYVKVADLKTVEDYSGKIDSVYRVQKIETLDNTPFTDVKNTSTFADAIKWVYTKKIMLGTSDNLFSPNAIATRGSVATVFYRTYGSIAQKLTNKISFKDIATSSHKNNILWLAENKIISGYDNGLFMPANSISRGTFAMLMYKLAGSPSIKNLPKQNLNYFSDIFTAQSKTQIAWCNSIGLATSPTHKFRPNDKLTRGELAGFVKKFTELVFKKY